LGRNSQLETTPRFPENGKGGAPATAARAMLR
jgi:hypothetical protein